MHVRSATQAGADFLGKLADMLGKALPAIDEAPSPALQVPIGYDGMAQQALTGFNGNLALGLSPLEDFAQDTGSLVFTNGPVRTWFDGFTEIKPSIFGDKANLDWYRACCTV